MPHQPQTSHPDQHYYLFPNMQTLDPAREMELQLQAQPWMMATMIEDDDLTFGGKPLSTWYEEDRRRYSVGVFTPPYTDYQKKKNKMAIKAGPVRIGVLIPAETQLLDVACVDVLAMMGKQYLSAITELPRATVDAAPTVEVVYVTSAAAAPFVTLTAGMTVRATHDLSHADVQPGKLDILLVPGPDPSSTFEKDVLDFLRGHYENPGTDVLSVCTGILLCGAAGIIEGKRVCGPRGMQDVLRKRFPGARFEGEKYRWLQDGNLWTSGGITNGNDLVAAYARSSKHFPSAIAELACKMAEVGDRPQLYDQSQARFTLGFVWTVLRSLFHPKRE